LSPKEHTGVGPAGPPPPPPPCLPNETCSSAVDISPGSPVVVTDLVDPCEAWYSRSSASMNPWCVRVTAISGDVALIIWVGDGCGTLIEYDSLDAIGQVSVTTSAYYVYLQVVSIGPDPGTITFEINTMTC